MKRTLLISLICVFAIITKAQQFDVNDDWLQKIEKAAPSKAEIETQKPAKILVFSLFTGFNHWATPHTAEVIKILGKKTGTFEAVLSNDIYQFEEKNLKQYDAVVLNNNCSKRPGRNLFFDVLETNEDLTQAEKEQKAFDLENNLIEFVEKGGGLVAVHGAIVMQTNSMEFSEMMGGSFDYHPKFQELTVELADAEHPLVKCFEGKPFIHSDEPYLFNKAYAKKNFRPLLYIEASKLEHKKPFAPEKKYVSWIKKHGKGRVFYASPAHDARSFEDPRLLKFILDGIQYTLGDLKCDDTPINLDANNL